MTMSESGREEFGSRMRGRLRWRGLSALLVTLLPVLLLGATPGLYFTTCNLNTPEGTFEVLPGGVAPSALLFDGFSALAGGDVNPAGLALDPVNERAYIALTDDGPPNAGGIWAFGLDGSFRGVVLAPSDFGATALDVGGVALDVVAQRLYASVTPTPPGTPQIVAVDLASSTVTTLVADPASPWEVETDGSAVYWVESGAAPYGAVKRVKVGDTDVVTLVGGLSSPTGLAIDRVAAKLYFADSYGIYRANMDGSSVETVLPLTEELSVGSLDVDPAGTLYWSDGIDQIFASDLDGTSYAPITVTTLASGGVRVLLPACRDGYDNDGDGATDYGLDGGCIGPDDEAETEPGLPCDDGLDNDGDGLVDYPADPACQTAAFTRENAQCQDGVNNDGATGIDFDGGASVNGGVPLDVADPQCADKPWRNKEAACGLGAELALVMGWLARARRVANTKP
jgi:hypothetical protein